MGKAKVWRRPVTRMISMPWACALLRVARSVSEIWNSGFSKVPSISMAMRRRELAGTDSFSTGACYLISHMLKGWASPQFLENPAEAGLRLQSLQFRLRILASADPQLGQPLEKLGSVMSDTDSCSSICIGFALR